MTIASRKLADALIEARRAGRLARLTPDLVPVDIAAAMRTQKVVAEAIGGSIGGWKVGYTPDAIPVAAPIYAHLMHRSGATLGQGPSRRSGIEVEIALLLGRDLPPRPGRAYGRTDILDAAQALLAGIEIVEPRFPESSKPPFLAILAANINNGGYVRGEEVRDFRGLDLSHLRASLVIDGRKVHEGVGGHAKLDPLIPVLDYANTPCDLLGGLRAGHIVTTGTLSGCPYVEGAAKVVAEIEGLGEVEVEIKP